MVHLSSRGRTLAEAPVATEARLPCLSCVFCLSQRMPHGMYEAYYPSQGGRNCSKFTVSDGNVQTRMNIVNVNRHT